MINTQVRMSTSHILCRGGTRSTGGTSLHTLLKTLLCLLPAPPTTHLPPGPCLVAYILASEVVVLFFLRPMKWPRASIVGVIPLPLEVCDSVPEELEKVPGGHYSCVDDPDPAEDLVADSTREILPGAKLQVTSALRGALDEDERDFPRRGGRHL